MNILWASNLLALPTWSYFWKKTNGPILPLRLQQKIGDLLERGRKKFEPHVGIK